MRSPMSAKFEVSDSSGLRPPYLNQNPQVCQVLASSASYAEHYGVFRLHSSVFESLVEIIIRQWRRNLSQSRVCGGKTVSTP